MRARTRFLNRELSWLDFNDRVLAWPTTRSPAPGAGSSSCAIFSANLDEFFQVRVAGLQGPGRGRHESPAARRPHPQRSSSLEIAERVAHARRAQEPVFLDEVVPGLAEAGIRIAVVGRARRPTTASTSTRSSSDRIFPVLTPLAVDPSHPFPYISNLSLNLAVTVRDPDSAEAASPG